MIKDPLRIGKEVLSIMKQANYEAYFVGGCVRDMLLGKELTDIDITTNATPDQIMELFQTVIPIGIDHGTVLVRYKKISFEITTYRTEGTYTDHRRPDEVKFVRNLEEDVKRRDFTINAIAMDEEEKVIDLLDGRADLEQKLIRSVGDPAERFLEDPLRIVRALRFSSQLGFLIEEETFKQMIKLKEHLQYIAVERITEEMRKLFSGRFVQQGLFYLKESKIYEHLPIFKEDPTLIHLLPKDLIPLFSFSDVIALFTLLDRKQSISTWVKKWKESRATMREAKTLVQAVKTYNKEGLSPLLVFNLPKELFTRFVTLTNLLVEEQLTIDEVEEVYKNLIIKTPQQLAITGADLIELFPEERPGKWIEHLLSNLTKKVLLKELSNDRNELKEWAKCNFPNKTKEN